MRFLARTVDGMVFLTATEAVARFPKLPGADAIQGSGIKAVASLEPVEYATLRMRPLKGNPAAKLVAKQPLPGVSNYLRGSDPDTWVTGVPSYAAVTYEGVYPGVDLVYYGTAGGGLEYDFRVGPGADPSPIAMVIEGAEHISIGAAGDLFLDTAVGRVRQRPPFIYQEIQGKRQPVPGAFRLLAPEQAAEEIGATRPAGAELDAGPRAAAVAFTLGAYDQSRELVIDPEIVYSTYLGGAAGNFDGAADLALDAAGNAYLTGTAESTDFPIQNPFDGTGPARFGSNAFVTKFGPTGVLLYSTFLGSSAEGSSTDGSSTGTAIAVDATGAIYVAGTTGAGFPLQNPFQPTLAGAFDAFVAKLSPNGAALVYASYLGGNHGESPKAVALDSSNALYVIGEITPFGPTAVTFPLVNPTQAAYGGGASDAFMTVVAPNGEGLLFSTFLDVGSHVTPPRSTVDRARTLVIDPTDGSVLIGGSATFSEQEPASAFVAKFGRTGLGLNTQAVPFLYFVIILPLLLNDAFQPPEAFAVKAILAWLFGSFQGNQGLGANRGAAGSRPEITTVLEGLCHPVAPATSCNDPAVVAFFDQDFGFRRAVPIGVLRDFFLGGVATDSLGAIYLVGDTTSNFLHTVNPLQPTNGGVSDLVVAVLAPGTFAPTFVSYLGGSGTELPTRIQVDPMGNLYVTGIVTLSPNFPTTPGAFQRELKGRNDAFLVKISPVSFPTATPTVTPTTTPTRTATPTATPGQVIGGRDFSLQTNPGGPAVARWVDGNMETGYVGYRINLSSAGAATFPAMGTLPADSITYTDPAPIDIACYLTLVLAGGQTFNSDAICLFRVPPSGAGPRNFTAQLNQTATTTLAWNPPQGGGQSGYSLQVIPLAGPLPPPIPLGPNVTTYQHNTGGQVTCYLLTAQGGATGATDALCAYPNGFFLGSTPLSGGAAPPLDQLRDRLTLLAPRRP